MARLPTVESFGQRPTPRPVRPIASVSPQAAAAPAQALQVLGNTAAAAGDAIHEREATAAAKERDAYVSDQIRELLYNPESGFVSKNGVDAVNARKATLEQLENLKAQALDGLNGTAQRKLGDALNRRIDSAMQTIDIHTTGERKTWINGASLARIQAAQQDSLFNPEQTKASLAIIETETRDLADREGWSDEKLQVELANSKSKVYADQVTRIAATDPITAMQHLRDNQGSMTAEDVTNLEIKLQPEIKGAIGRQRAQEVLVGTGDLSGAFNVASGGLGLNEAGRKAALEQYLKDGGQSLDPAVTAWCAAFVNATLAKAGMGGTDSLMARSFLDWGQEVTTPKRGDIVVLSRGQPPYGHVGFFDGVNEDGTVRILGGNQGNAVNIKSYDASRVLGYRRAVNPDAGSVADGLAQLVEIEDPAIRDAAIKEYNLRVSTMQGQATARRNAAQSAAFQAIEAGHGVDSLPLDFRQSLGMEGMSALRTYESKLASGGQIRTDPQTYLELRTMQANDPAAFGDINLIEYVDRLSQTDFQSFVDQQAEGVDTEVGFAASTIMSNAKRQLEAAGFDTTPNAGSDDAASVAAIQTRLLRWQDDFMRENKRKPTQTEIDERVANELIPVVVNPPGFGNEMDGAFFELANLDLDAGELVESTVTVLGTEVPAAVVNEQIIALREAGEDVTAENLVARIVTMFEEAGLR